MKSASNDKRLLVIAFIGSVLFHTLVIFAFDFRFETRERGPRILNVQLVSQPSTPSAATENPEQELNANPAALDPDTPKSIPELPPEQTNSHAEISVVEPDRDSNLQPETTTTSVQPDVQGTEPPANFVEVSEPNTPTNLSPQISIRDLVDATAAIALEQSGEQNVRNIEGDETTNTEEEYYLKAWLKKVQEIGQLNYPQEAIEQKLYGKLRLYVAIKPDGTVEETRIIRSSGHEVLDEAAKHIVELASPFSAFPQSMRENLDLLEIVREWEFRKEALVPSSNSEED